MQLNLVVRNKTAPLVTWPKFMKLTQQPLILLRNLRMIPKRRTEKPRGLNGRRSMTRRRQFSRNRGRRERRKERLRTRKGANNSKIRWHSSRISVMRSPSFEELSFVCVCSPN